MAGASLFSVVIPAFNQGKWLVEAIDSALTQEEPAREVLVVDDGSTDNTPALLEKHAGRVRVLRQSNEGLSAVRNRGAKEVTTRYVVFLDGDDRLFPWSLRLLGSVIRSCGNPAVALSHARPFRDPAELRKVTPGPIQVDRWNDYLESVRGRYWIGVTGAIRRDLIVDHGGFLSEGIGAEDHDFWLRTGTEPGFAYVRGPPLYAYRQHGESATRDPAGIARGIRFVLRQEREGNYPGGTARIRERRAYLSRLVCWGVARCFENKGLIQGYRLYLEGLRTLAGAGFTRECVRLPLLPLLGIGKPSRRTETESVRGKEG